MKKILLMAFVALALASCSKEPNKNEGGLKDGDNLLLKVKLSASTPEGKAIESTGGSANGHKIKASVQTLQVYAYNASGNLLQTQQVPAPQIANALYGDGSNPDGSPVYPTSAACPGLSLSLPAGTERIEVTANYENQSFTNVNAYQEFKSVPLVSNHFLVYQAYTNGVAGIPETLAGQKLSDIGTEAVVGSNSVWKINVSISPVAARFEVVGGLSLDPEELYVVNGKRFVYDNTITGYYVSEETSLDYFIKIVAMKYGSLADGLTQDVYLAKYNELDNALNAARVPTSVNFYCVYWFPNAYYAVDVEQVFINNIYIRGGSLNSSYIPVYNPFDAKGAGPVFWSNWYAAYASGQPAGWNPLTSLSFYNMWDEIATERANQANALIAQVSQYYQTTAGIGVFANKAAAYNFYSQKVSTNPAPETPAEKEAIAKDCPHIILKVKCYASAADYAAGIYVPNKEFVTIPVFRSTESGTPRIREYKRGFIYRFNIADLKSLFHGGNPVDPQDPPKDPVDPNPETGDVAVELKIQVLPWTLLNVTPEV